MAQTNQMTDAQLRQLYFGIAKHYNDLRKAHPPKTLKEIYDELYSGVYHSINNPISTLSQLDPSEKLKAYKVLNTYFQARQNSPAPERTANPAIFAPFAYRYGTPPVIIVKTYDGPHYCCHNDFLFTWLMLSSFNRPSYGYYGSYYRDHVRPRTHGHPSNSKDDANKALYMLILVALSLAAMALTVVALYYLFSQTLNSMERFKYNEGWMQACMPFLGMAASAAASAILTSMFLAAPLASLAFAAGVANPVGLAVFGVVCLSIVGASVGGFLTEKIQNLLIKDNNAIDPADPYRFTLTEAETNNLLRKGLDPDKVKCAIIELRSQMGDKPIPSLLKRTCSSKYRDIQENLDKIRKIRRGELIGVQVESMYFDFTADKHAYAMDVGVDDSLAGGEMGDVMRSSFFGTKTPSPRSPVPLVKLDPHGRQRSSTSTGTDFPSGFQDPCDYYGYQRPSAPSY